MKTFTFKCAILALTWFSTQLLAAPADSLVVTFSNPSQPGTIKAETMMGGVKVRTHNRADVIIISRESENTPKIPMPGADVFFNKENDFNAAAGLARFGEQNKPDPEKAKGLTRVQSSQFGINVEEENNIIQINMPAMAFIGGGNNEIELVVPKKTSLQLKCMAGEMNVEGVTGEIELEAMGGSITLKDVGGSVVAHTMGDINAVVQTVTPAKPMSFSTFSGDIDVTLPASIKATFKLKSHGEIYTDFDTSTRKMAKNVKQNRNPDRFEAEIEKVLEIPVNGGGQDLEFTNFSGNIYIRKLK